ncbi:hypothetical protein ILUMI_25066, partial [Ignelater luminosus]
MADWNYRHKALTLNELIDELDDPDNIPLPPSGISINIFPHNDEIVTDKILGKKIMCVVLRYTNILLDIAGKVVPFHLFFDNYFTSLALVNELTIKATGTIRYNRTGNRPLMSSKELKNKDRGYIDYRCSREDNLILCKWNDNNIVGVASNVCTMYPVRNVQCFSRKEKKIDVNQPNLVKIYNDNMGGVDRAGQNMSPYRISIRGKKWYFPLIAHCLEVAIQNA